MAGTRTPLLALLVVATVLLAREAAAGEALGILPVQCSGQGCDPRVNAVRQVRMSKHSVRHTSSCRTAIGPLQHQAGEGQGELPVPG